MATYALLTRLPLGLLLALPLVAQADLSWNPATLALGTRATHTTHSGTVYLRNLGDEVISVSQVHSTIPTLSLSGGVAVLAPGDSIQVGWQFHPIQNLPYAGALVAESSGEAVACPVSAAGDWAGTTWDSTYGLTGEALKTQLRNLVRVHSELSYDNARLIMFSTLNNVNGWVECVYTGFDVQTTGIPDPNIMNTEHTWPQSLFDGLDSIRTDLHHLFPTRNSINSSRGNLPFGEVVTSSSGYPQQGCDRGTDVNGVTVFEPRSQHKGDCARALFYTSVHYGNPTGFLNYMEPVLRSWSSQDPVDSWESNRNTGVQTAQGNRNPFVDHPELLDRMASISGNANLPAVTTQQAWPSLALDLGSGPAGSLAGSLVLVNTGTTTLNPGGLTVGSPLFSATGLPASLAPGQSATLQVTALHTVPGVYSTGLSFSTQAGVISRTLQAEIENTVVLEAPALDIEVFFGIVSLDWDPVAGAALYRVERQDENGAWFTVGVLSQTSYAELSPPAPSRRNYRVIALP